MRVAMAGIRVRKLKDRKNYIEKVCVLLACVSTI